MTDPDTHAAPRPWRVDRRGKSVYLLDCTGRTIAMLYGLMESRMASAELIVRLVNDLARQQEST